jgi:hypothetical protein
MKIVDEVGNVQQKRKKEEDNTCYFDHCIIFRHINPCKPNSFDFKKFIKDLILFVVKEYLPM